MVGEVPAHIDAGRSVHEVEVDEGEFRLLGQLQCPAAIGCDPHGAMAKLLQDAFDFDGDENFVLHHQHLATHVPVHRHASWERNAQPRNRLQHIGAQLPRVSRILSRWCQTARLGGQEKSSRCNAQIRLAEH